MKKMLRGRHVGLFCGFAMWVAGCGMDMEVQRGESHAREQIDTLAFDVYFGEVHSHSSNSFDANRQGAGDPAATFAFARDVAQIDFSVITDHAETITAREWSDYLTALESYNQAGSFVTLGAWEWTSTEYGHKNVYFRDALPARPIGFSGRDGRGHEVIADPASLWQALTDRGYVFFTAPHHPAYGVDVMATDWSQVDSVAQPLVEVYSKHGNSDVEGGPEPVLQLQPDKTVSAALLRWLSTGDDGYKLGIIAGTDDHTSRPGCVDETDFCQAQDSGLAQYHAGSSSGGLTAVLAPELSRASLFDAMAARRVYATSGPRIVLSFGVQQGAAYATMGETLYGPGAEQPVTVQGAVAGDTAPIDRVEVFHNEAHVATLRPGADGAFGWSSQMCAGRHILRLKAYQSATPNRDGELIEEMAWSSPVWIDN